jgi:UDP-N-acetylmuramyl pentapeptide synthase
VAIAGLGGKTVMKRWLREMLEPVRRVRANPRSYNTEIGLPLAVLGTEIEGRGVRAAARAVARAAVHGLFSRDPVDVLILEMGLRRAGDAQALLGSVLPDVLVLTPIAPSFPGDLSFLRTIETEVAILAREVAAGGGAVVACRDDARVVAAIDGVPRVATFGREQARTAGSGGFVLESGGTTYDVGLDAVGDSSFYALLAGIEVARLLGVDDAAVRRFLAGTR